MFNLKKSKQFIPGADKGLDTSREKTIKFRGK